MEYELFYTLAFADVLGPSHVHCACRPPRNRIDGGITLCVGGWTAREGGTEQGCLHTVLAMSLPIQRRRHGLCGGRIDVASVESSGK